MRILLYVEAKTDHELNYEDLCHLRDELIREGLFTGELSTDRYSLQLNRVNSKLKEFYDLSTRESSTSLNDYSDDLHNIFYYRNNVFPLKKND